MKQNGFIATSLIYSFFLVFVTLFLTIIADYLQNKVLLTEIEKGIKDNINYSMGIRDFEVGDMIMFNFEYKINNNLIIGSYNPDAKDIWIVANVIIDSIDSANSSLVLYSYRTDFDSSCLTSSDIMNDLGYNGYLNNTYLDKILNNYFGESFYMDDRKINRSCMSISNNSFDINTCDELTEEEKGSHGNCRQRKDVVVGNKRFTLPKGHGDAAIITLKDEV